MSIFDDYYRNNYWGSTESVSGNGSTMHATRIIRRDLPKVFKHYGIMRVMDVACGDCQWFEAIEWDSEIRFLGCDIVPDLIYWLNENYGPNGMTKRNTDTFEVKDFRVDPLSPEEPADLILARDVLVHFSNYDVKRALANIRKSGAKWLMATTFPGHTNEDIFDIKTGDWRPLNLQRMWGLPRPELLINEGCDIPGYEDKSLGLWQLR